MVAELGATPLIGFAGAPFTVASYLIEGRPSRTYGLTKAMLHGEPKLWSQLLDRLADMAIASLLAQVDAGASAIQLFDSWAGALSPDVYAEHVLPHSAKVFAALEASGVPRIHFGVGTGELLGADGRRRRRRRRRRLARAARRGPRRGSPARPCRATSTRPCAWRRGTSSPIGRATCSAATPAGPVTSSTSVTACSPSSTPAC